MWVGTHFFRMEPKVFVISASSLARWIYSVCDPSSPHLTPLSNAPPPVFWPSCDLLRRAVRRRRNLPARSDLSSLHYHPNTLPAHIVLQGPGQIAIFMGHDKGNAALCSHFLLPGAGAGVGGAVIHRGWEDQALVVCCVSPGQKDGPKTDRRETRQNVVGIHGVRTILQVFFTPRGLTHDYLT